MAVALLQACLPGELLSTAYREAVVRAYQGHEFGDMKLIAWQPDSAQPAAPSRPVKVVDGTDASAPAFGLSFRLR